MAEFTIPPRVSIEENGADVSVASSLLPQNVGPADLLHQDRLAEQGMSEQWVISNRRCWRWRSELQALLLSDSGSGRIVLKQRGGIGVALQQSGDDQPFVGV